MRSDSQVNGVDTELNNHDYSDCYSVNNFFICDKKYIDKMQSNDDGLIGS